MTFFLTILAVIVIFSLLVLIHELGHFLVAKKAGVRVLEFGIGFPPRIFGKKYGETIYSVNAIPFGGFVRLFGEDARDPNALKDKRSFAMKTPWIRTKIALAGVFMNFLLAYVLLATGFTFGIQPLILNEQDLFQHLSTGIVETKPGVTVRKVKQGSQAEKAGIQAGDELLRWDGKAILNLDTAQKLEKADVMKDVDLTILRNGVILEAHLVKPEPKKKFGLELATMTNLPRPVIASVEKGSPFAKAGLKPGDTILAVGGLNLYTPKEFFTELSAADETSVTLFRGQQIQKTTLVFQKRPRVFITEVFPETAAFKAGIQAGDILLKIGDAEVRSPEEAQSFIRNSERKPLKYTFQRGDKKIAIETPTDEKNILGVALAMLARAPSDAITIYQDATLTSLTKIHNVKYPFPQALSQAFRETSRLTKVTILAFGRTFKRIFTKFEVPQDVGGPVRIAYYTHAFVQEGFFALLRFTALLSLSLAVINIIPFPALDGGRFFFIVLEVIFRKRINARFENLVHSFGFLLLLLFLLFVTFSDFARIFS